MNKVKTVLVKNFEGNTINLMAKYANENIVLLFYNNACLGCTGRAIPLVYQFQQDYSNIQVIGVHTNFSIVKTSEENI